MNASETRCLSSSSRLSEARVLIPANSGSGLVAITQVAYRSLSTTSLARMMKRISFVLRRPW